MAVSAQITVERPPSAQLKFATLFHLWDFIESDTVRQAAWRRTKHFALSTATLLRRWLNPRQLLGVSFGDMTHYGMIDIDRGSDYHPANDPSALDGLRASFEAVGLTRSILIRSSASGGLHLYFPLPSKVKTWSLAALLHVTCVISGFIIKPGTLELFPNVKQWATGGDISLYKAHRLPLQQGSGVLDRDGAIFSGDLDTFMVQWQTAANNQDAIALKKALKTASHRSDLLPFRHPRSRKANDFYKDDEAVIAQGWTQSGKTNEILCAIARHLYVFHDKSGEELARATAETARSRPGYDQYCNHKHHIEKRAKEWARCVEKKYYPYGSRKTAPKVALPDPNDLKRTAARDRIAVAVAAYESTDDFPSGITARAKILATNGISLATLYRHRDLWHPDYISEASVIPFPSASQPSAEIPEPPPKPPEPAPEAELQAVVPKKFVQLPKDEKNKQPGEKDSTDLEARVRQEVGEDWSDTLVRAIAERSPEIVEDALAALQQQRDRTTVINPGAWLACAIRAAWKPNYIQPQPLSLLSPQPASVSVQPSAAQPEVNAPAETQAPDAVAKLPECVRGALDVLRASRQKNNQERLLGWLSPPEGS